ncbi:putative exopolygalacturonase protein [Phialemonium atrogriseum]|uniref:galacturonan 1,4-alpha-galacturonidase n=1 Tax=Phialemonium atrogriseum TaxID=1093897 RepID=A0AAJ0C291_9PEZI|nr:putative exopolygalacturonase protein [Phialemonium atrogriseum]KAK1768818.1 putative exopolygalacturonase protein [Phialemonium atrogriseum]
MFQPSSALAVACLAAAANAVISPFKGLPVIERPEVKAWPLSPGKPHAVSPPRDPNRYCFVRPSCKAGNDDAPKILRAFHECNNGGTVVLDATYTIASPLDLTFLDSVDMVISGTINFSSDVNYWVEHTFKYPFQDSSSMWRIGGRDVNIYGGGVGLINGNGQNWYDAFAKNPTLLRPILLVLDGLHGGSVSGLRMVNSPNWFNIIANSTDIIVSDLDINVKSTSSNPAKNTDGWDTYRSDSVVIQNSVVHNGDDCVSFKPNSTNVVIQGLQCFGSHGISVGSLGQYIDSFDIVENLYIYNISMSDASDGARIKVWPGIDSDFQPGLSGGGGSGYVRNVTYDGMKNTNNEWAIELTQCYGQKNQTLCNMYPANLTISDITFKNFWGTASKKHDPKVGTLVCSSPDRCWDIRAQNITVTPPSGKTAQWECINMDKSQLDINCV